MSRQLYNISQFARKASVSVRTLRYYDRKGLLSPSGHNKLGHRLYSDRDLISLQYILALKFLGFSLEEIKAFLYDGSVQFEEVLRKQKMMMMEKQAHINAVIRAIEETEKILEAGRCDYPSVIKIIEVIQMEQKSDWMDKYLTDEQRGYMRDLARMSYSEEALKKLAERGWTKENQKKFSPQYEVFRAELKRLVDEEADPAGEDARKLAKMLRDMNERHSQGDPDIAAGMKRSWENYNALPDARKPLDYMLSEAEKDFIKKAMTAFHKRT